MFHATTIVAVKKGTNVAIAGDGQVTMGETTIMKHTAKKVRRLYGGKVIEQLRAHTLISQRKHAWKEVRFLNSQSMSLVIHLL